MRLKITLEVSCLEMRIRRKLFHGFRLLRDGKAKESIFVPDFYRLNEFTGGENTVANCTDPFAVDTRSGGVGYAGVENPVPFGWYGRE